MRAKNEHSKAEGRLSPAAKRGTNALRGNCRLRLLFSPTILFLVVQAGCGSSNSSTSSSTTTSTVPTITVTLTPSSQAFIDQGQTLPITAAVANDSTNGGVTWSLTGQGGLTSQTSTGVTYNAPSGGSNSITVSVTAASQANSGVTASLNVTVAPRPTIITPPTLLTGTTGSAYSASISGVGGTAPLTWTVSSGALPPGLSLSPASASSVILGGAPTAAGSYNFVLQAADATNATTIRSFSLLITPGGPGPLKIATPSLPVGIGGRAYNATLLATGGTPPYTWSITSGALPSGLSLSTQGDNSGLISGNTASLGSSQLVVQVSDSAAPAPASYSKPYTLTMNSATLAISPAPLPHAMATVPYGQTLQVTGGIPPYDWAIASGVPPSGVSLTRDGSMTGIPAQTGGFNFMASVSDSEPAPASTMQSILLTVDAYNGPNDSLLNGHYAFLLEGFDPNGMVAAAGSFTADGSGHITNGLADFNDPAGLTADQTFTGTYQIGGNELGTMTITTDFGQTITFAFVVQANGNAKVIEFDDLTGRGTRGSGAIKKQDTTAFSAAKIAGDYAYGFSGIDSTGAASAMAGTFQASGATGKLTSGEYDFDDSGQVSAAQLFTGSDSVTTVGRGTLSFVTPSQGTLHFTIYVVSATELFAVETDSVSGGSTLLSGSVLQQTGGGSFSAASLGNSSVVQMTGASGGGSDAQAGLLTIPSSANFSLATDENLNGTSQSNSESGTYTVESNGRVTLTTTGSTAPVLYLVAQNQGFVVGTDGSAALGTFEPQAAGTFSNSSFSGTYATRNLAPVAASMIEQVFTATADGSGGFSATANVSAPSGITSSQSESASYSVAANGRVTLNFTSPAGATAVGYVVSATKVILVPQGSGAAVLILEQ